MVATDVSFTGTNRGQVAGCEYGQDKAIFGYGSIPGEDSDCDFDSIGNEHYLQLMKWIDDLASRFYDGKVNYKDYKKEIKIANKKLKQHNLRVKKLASHEVATYAMGSLAEDFFENIKEDKNAN